LYAFFWVIPRLLNARELHRRKHTTVHTLATGEYAEWPVWTQQLPLNDLPWDPALAEAWSVMDLTLSAEWSVMVPNT